MRSCGRVASSSSNHGPSTAPATSSTRKTAAASAKGSRIKRRSARSGPAAGASTSASVVAISGVPHARIEHRIGEVDRDVHEEDHAGGDEDAGLDDREVALDDRIDQELADARPAEHGLDDHGTIDDAGGEIARDGDRRQHG